MLLGVVASFAGSNQPGYSDGRGSSAKFNVLNDLQFAIPSADIPGLIVTESTRIRRVLFSGLASTLLQSAAFV